MDLSCSNSKCGYDDIKYVNLFRSHMQSYLKNNIGKKSGYWVCGCYMHTLADHTKFWDQTAVENVIMKNAVFGWYHDTFYLSQSSAGTWHFMAAEWKKGGFPVCGDAVDNTNVDELKKDMEVYESAKIDMKKWYSVK